jgi:hypothetical protein
MTQKFWKHMLPGPSITQSALTPTSGLCTSQEENHNSCQRHRTEIFIILFDY